MICRGRSILGAWAIVSCLAMGPARGQSATPLILGIDPPGATVGQPQEWRISGRNLAGMKRLLISGAGVEVLRFSIEGDTRARASIRLAAGALPGYREVRLDGPSGISNLTIVRVDDLRQVTESPRGSRPQEVEVGSAVAGVLMPLDVDTYRIRGTPGRRLTLDLEARRIGSSIAPVLTVVSDSGLALARAVEMRGADRDCRLPIVVPAEGTFLVQVRDNTYGGGEHARYRLRVDPRPFATAVFPLGSRKGEAVEVEVSGGDLPGPLRKSIKLPDSVGSTVEVGLVEGPGGPILASGKLRVGDGPEISEPADRPDRSPIALSPGLTVNGRVDRPGEVNVYSIAVKAGDRVHARIDASAMGSWLDSVLAVRDEKGGTIAENDDAEAARPDQARAVNAMGLSSASPDSAMEFEAKADGVLTVEVSDRFGDGGPEFGYRLSVGPARQDFSVALVLGNSRAASLGLVPTPVPSPVPADAFNLKPGGSTPINFVVTPSGRPGPVEVRVEGLPEGVTAEPVTVRLAGSAVADFLRLKVAPHAAPGLSEFRVVATSRPSPGESIVREATATIGLATAGASTRPITRVVSRVPLRILGEARPMFVGPPAPPTLRRVAVPGPLLQGGRIDLVLDFDRSVTADDGSTVEAVAGGVGLATTTVISAGTTIVDGEPSSDVAVHVLASTRARPGPHPVRITYTPPGGPPTVREVTVNVRVPISIQAGPETIFLSPGDSASLAVEVRREAGFDGEVELKLEGLPRGVKLAEPVILGAGRTSAVARLEMNATARPLARPAELRVIGVARMPRGSVAVDSKIRAMIRARESEK